MSQVTNNPALLPPGIGPTQPAAPAGPAKGTGAATGAQRGAGAAPQGPSFADTLTQAGEQLHFSKHALARVERRGIELDPSTLGRLSQGVQRAASKGSRDSLVLVDGNAFVVSVSNRTVITAVGSEHMKDNVFTNIDSAVIA
jgi:flagellar operon protein